MRIWSIHPEYIDAKGLVALWRETLLAKHVLEGKTKGYTHHPQLDRFKASENGLHCLHFYLQAVYLEATKRGYHFNQSKFDANVPMCQLDVTQGQMNFEFKHLLNKLKQRDVKKHDEVCQQAPIKPHPLFRVIEGKIENWERL